MDQKSSDQKSDILLPKPSHCNYFCRILRKVTAQSGSSNFSKSGSSKIFALKLGTIFLEYAGKRYLFQNNQILSSQGGRASGMSLTMDNFGYETDKGDSEAHNDMSYDSQCSMYESHLLSDLSLDPYR